MRQSSASSLRRDAGRTDEIAEHDRDGRRSAASLDGMQGLAGPPSPSLAIAFNRRLRSPRLTPSCARSSSVRSGKTSASIESSRKAASYRPRPRLRSQTADVHGRTPIGVRRRSSRLPGMSSATRKPWRPRPLLRGPDSSRSARMGEGRPARTLPRFKANRLSFIRMAKSGRAEALRSLHDRNPQRHAAAEVRNSDAGAAPHAALRRRDRGGEIRRARHGRRAEGARLRQGHGAARAVRHQSGGRPRRRPSDRLDAEEARHRIAVLRRSPGHRQADHRDR